MDCRKQITQEDKRRRRIHNFTTPRQDSVQRTFTRAWEARHISLTDPHKKGQSSTATRFLSHKPSASAHLNQAEIYSFAIAPYPFVEASLLSVPPQAACSCQEQPRLHKPLQYLPDH